VPSASEGEHLSALITFKFSAKITHTTPLEHQPRVISTLTGVVATWSLGENHPTLWLIVSLGENHPVLLLV